jgi:hypothetical protein
VERQYAAVTGASHHLDEMIPVLQFMQLAEAGKAPYSEMEAG